MIEPKKIHCLKDIYMDNEAVNKIKAISESVADLVKTYSGQWVTLSKDKSKVLGVSKRMEKALQEAKNQGEPHPLLIKVPDASTAAFLY